MEENMKLVLNELRNLNGKVEGLTTKVDGLDKKIDKVEDNLNQKIDTVEAGLNQKIDKVEASLNQKIDMVEDNLSKKIDSQGDILHQLIKIVGAPNPYIKELADEVTTIKDLQLESMKILERLSIRSISHEADIAELRRAR